MTRGQVRFIFGCIGILLLLIAGCFASDGEISWAWGVPAMLLGAVFVFATRRLRSQRRHYNAGGREY